MAMDARIGIAREACDEAIAKISGPWCRSIANDSIGLRNWRRMIILCRLEQLSLPPIADPVVLQRVRPIYYMLFLVDIRIMLKPAEAEPPSGEPQTRTPHPSFADPNQS